MLVSFASAVPGVQYFFPGRRKFGEVIQVYGRKNRRSISVMMDDGIQVDYSARQWLAVTVDEAEKYMIHEPPVEGKQIVGLTKTKLGKRESGNKGKQVRGRPLTPRKSRANARRAARENTEAALAPVTVKVIDDRPIPDIPGPPVPKPKAGVWSDDSWRLLP